MQKKKLGSKKNESSEGGNGYIKAQQQQHSSRREKKRELPFPARYTESNARATDIFSRKPVAWRVVSLLLSFSENMELEKGGKN